MTNMASGSDGQDAFSYAAHIPDGDSCAEIWAARAKAFRDRQTGMMPDMACAGGKRKKLDIFAPGGSPDGLFDLRSLRLNAMHETQGLTPESAISESSALLSPHLGGRLTTWVGENESPKFLRQSVLIVETWRPEGSDVKLAVALVVHHFNVIEALQDPGSLLMREQLGAGYAGVCQETRRASCAC